MAAAADDVSETEDEGEDDEESGSEAAAGGSAAFEAAARAAAQQQQRLRLVLSMRRQEYMLQLLQLAHAQEVLLARAEQEEQEQLALALARSLEPSAAAAPPAPLPPRNSLARLDEALPPLPFAEAKGFLVRGEAAGELECAVCLAELQPKDTVRLLPCVHVFHKECVDKWLARSAACPTCKGTVPLE